LTRKIKLIKSYKIAFIELLATFVIDDMQRAWTLLGDCSGDPEAGCHHLERDLGKLFQQQLGLFHC